MALGPQALAVNDAPLTPADSKRHARPWQGGIEQAFLDYNEALSQVGYRPVPVTSRGGTIEPWLQAMGLRPIARSRNGAGGT